jgi:possible phosphopantetheinyl transferase
MELKTKKMKLYLIKDTKQTWTKEHDMLMSILPITQQQHVQTYRFDEDRILSLYASFLSRIALGRLLHCKPQDLCILRLTGRKPILDTTALSGNPQVDFSYSHTRNAVLLGVTEEGSIGVDIERIQQAPLELMETIFHPDEIRYVEQGDATTRPQRFFEIWTKKEAYTKCMGTGLITELTKLNTFDASIFPHLYAWQVDDYMCAVCCYH